MGNYEKENQTNQEFILENFDKLIKWLEELEIRTDIGRISEYKKFINSIRSKQENYLLYLPIIANYNKEILELIWIYKNFFDFEINTKLRNFIKSTLKGAILPNYESSKKDDSRNYLLELRVASYLLKSNFKIDLEQDCDVVASRNNVKLYIECKKIHSISMLQKRVKEAENQLDKRLKNDNSKTAKIGIIWLDLSSIIANELGIYSSYYRHVSRISAIADLEDFAYQYLSFKFEKNNKITCLIIQNIYCAINTEPKKVYTGFATIPIQITKNIFLRWKTKKIISNIISQVEK